MTRKAVSGLVLMLLFTSMLSSALLVQPVKAEPDTTVCIDPSIITTYPARAPWPMFQHDPQHTGRSPYIGPNENPKVGILLGNETVNEHFGFPVIDSDGTLYLTKRMANGNPSLCAFSPDGIQKWAYESPSGGGGEPTLSESTSTVYFLCDHRRLRALDMDTGNVKWEKSYLYIHQQPTINDDGITYFIALCELANGARRTTLVGLDHNGIEVLKFDIGPNLSSPVPTRTTVDRSDVVYFGFNDTLFAVSPSGVEEWRRKFETIEGFKPMLPHPEVRRTPVIADDGTLFVVVFGESGDRYGSVQYLHAINPNDPMADKWTYTLGYATYVPASPSIDISGNLYILTGRMFHTRVRYSLSKIAPTGTRQWFEHLELSYGKPGVLLVDSGSNIYVTKTEMGGRLHIFDDTGSQKMVYCGREDLARELSLAADGTLYVAGDEHLYAVTSVNQDDLVPVSSADVVTIYEQTGVVYIHTFLVSVLMGSSGTFIGGVGEHYTVTSDGTYLTIHCFRDDWRSGFAVGNNIVAVRLDGVPDFPEGLWASLIADYTLGYNGIAESRFNALGADTQIGPYAPTPERGLCTYMGDQHSELVLGFVHTPAPPYQLPSADFTYTPYNPIIGEEITFDAFDSYDPDGGTIANYRWEFYSITEYVPFPLVGMKEGADKKTVNYTFYSKGTYIVNLTVTDDEGETDSIDKTVRVWEKWSFAIIADPHVGGLYDPNNHNPLSWHYTSKDYGSPCWDDGESGEEDVTTAYLTKTVNKINSNIRLGNEYNIAFVIVLGDFADSAEESEFSKTKDILKELDVPWIPIPGNHDIWPYCTGTQRYSGDTPDEAFRNAFKDQYQKLATETFPDSWDKSPTPPNGKEYYLQNFAFDYKGHHFVCLDFNSRKLAIPPPELPVPIGAAGVLPWACLHDFEDGTWNWFQKHFEEYPNKGNENTIIFSHHPMRLSPMAFHFDEWEEMAWYINTNNLRTTIWGNFAGHTHKSISKYLQTTGMYCVETDANFKAPQARIVQIFYDGAVDYSALLPDSVEWFRVTACSPVDLTVTDPDGLTISKELGEIPDALYVEFDFDEDGFSDDLITIPQRKTGIYTITVVPEPDAEPTDTYTLEVSGEDATIVLAENVPISDVPPEPYVFNPMGLDIPPTTFLDIGEPQFVHNGIKCFTSTSSTALMAEDNVGGSGVASTAYRICNATYDSGWITYTEPFYLIGLSDGAYQIDYNSTDTAGNVELSNTVAVILDNTGPSVTVENPPAGWALQDGVTFIISTIDASGTSSMNISIREADGGEGTPVGFEDLQVTYDAVTGKWTLFFDTLQLPDGYYVLHIEGDDNLGNGASTTIHYSIRNWAVIELLPSSTNNKAGRTMPVKFALRVAASVDPNQPFVYNEELRIEIYATNNPTEILQESYFGDTSRDYRISRVLYITNFRTLRTPMEYTVAIYRDSFDVGSFTFETTK